MNEQACAHTLDQSPRARGSDPSSTARSADRHSGGSGATTTIRPLPESEFPEALLSVARGDNVTRVRNGYNRWCARGQGDHNAFCRRLAVDEAQVCGRNAVSEHPPTRAKHERVDNKQVLVDQLATHQRLDQLAASHHEQIARSLLLELATASAASPFNSVEFGHGSGSRSVREETYLGALLSPSLNGPMHRSQYAASPFPSSAD
jgi:hypothetical protein